MQVIHGDLAVRNVLLGTDKTAKLSDFGLARKLNDYSVYMKQSKVVLCQDLIKRQIIMCNLENRDLCRGSIWHSNH